jgi:hypothetical protein
VKKECLRRGSYAHNLQPRKHVVPVHKVPSWNGSIRGPSEPRNSYLLFKDVGKQFGQGQTSFAPSVSKCVPLVISDEGLLRTFSNFHIIQQLLEVIFFRNRASVVVRTRVPQHEHGTVPRVCNIQHCDDRRVKRGLLTEMIPDIDFSMRAMMCSAQSTAFDRVKGVSCSRVEEERMGGSQDETLI